MVSPVLYENYTTAEFLVSESPGTLSRGTIYFDNTGGSLDLHVQAGAVYSIETYGTPVVTPGGGNHGNGTVGTVTPLAPSGANPGAQLGTYLVSFTGATTYNVLAPDGRELAPGAIGQAYADELGFTITAGGTPYQAGDTISINNIAGTGLATPYVGTAPAAGIIYNQAYVPAGGTKLLTTIVRNAEVNLSELQWATGVTTNQMAAAVANLLALGIICR